MVNTSSCVYWPLAYLPLWSVCSRFLPIKKKKKTGLFGFLLLRRRNCIWYPGYQSFARFMFCKYFLTVRGFPLCFHKCVLMYRMFIILVKYNSSVFYGSCYLCPVLFLICLPPGKMFSFRTFRILAFTCKMESILIF